MSSRKSIVLVAVIAFAAAMATIWPARSAGQFFADTTDATTVLESPNLIVPRIRIINFDNSIARFDTTTGEISRFSGTLTGAAAQGTWLRFARPVAQSNSGLLDVTQIGEATFLTDVTTGQTWILRRRGNTASWLMINTVGG